MKRRTFPRLDAMIRAHAGGALREDGWANLFAGFGVKGRDPSLSDRVNPPPEFDRSELEWIYRADAIAARAVDILPDDATRTGWTVKVDRMTGGEDVDPKDASEISEGADEYFRKFGFRKTFRRGLCTGRLFGGGLGILGIQDGRDFSEPVDESNIQSISWLRVLDRFMVVPGELETDPKSPDFGLPRDYEVTSEMFKSTQRVHASRVIRFEGLFAPVIYGSSSNRLGGWDDSVITRLWDPLRHFSIAFTSSARIVRDFSRASYKIKGLHEKISGNSLDAIYRRVQIAELSISALNAILLDADSEAFEFMQRPVTGLPELLDRYGMFLSACAGMPMTLLLGLSPGGFGTGEDEDRRWNNKVSAYQTDDVRPLLERVYRYMWLAKDGPTQGRIPDRWSINFHPLRVPTQKEKAEVRKLMADAMTTLVSAGVLLPEEVAEGLFGKGEFGLDVTLDRERRKELEESQPDLSDPAQIEALLAASRGGQAPPEDDPGVPPRQDSIDIRWYADTALSVVERVHGGHLTIDVGVRFMNRVLGMPIDEAERLFEAA